jgi:hypothetical protein
VRRVLRHQGLPAEVPDMRPARSPPLVEANGAGDRGVADFDPA